MGWLSKIVLNGIEMVIKDSAGREVAESCVQKLNMMWNSRYPENAYYVAENGNDTTGDGTQSNPYATIQKAYDMAKEYPISSHNEITIFVSGGHYYENIVLGGTYYPARVILDCLGDVKIHGSLTIKNVECEIIGSEESTTLYIYDDVITDNENMALMNITEFATVYCNIKVVFEGPASNSAISHALAVFYGSRFYEGYKGIARGLYVFSVVTSVNSDLNINLDASNASGTSALYSEFSNIISRDESIDPNPVEE